MKRSIIFPLLLLIITAVSAQDESLSLNGKWNNMLDKAESYQHYKVIKKTELHDVWKSVNDSVSAFRSSLRQEREQIKIQQKEIDQLKEQVAATQAKFDNVTLEKDNIVFMGMQIDKYSYANTLWTIIGVIFAASGAMFLLYNNSNKVAKNKVNEYEDLFNRFEEYKKSTIDKERKLKRELQTHVNMIEELKGRHSRV